MRQNNIERGGWGWVPFMLSVCMCGLASLFCKLQTKISMKFMLQNQEHPSRVL